MNDSHISLKEVLDAAFSEHYHIDEKAQVVFGQGKIGAQPFHILGVKESTSFGAEQALIMAEKAITIIDSKSTDPVLLLVDVTGQKLSMYDEWIGMHQYFSHLLLCLECLRKQGNRLISLIYNQAIGGAFITYGLTADTVLALPQAKVAVMWLDAMAKVTKLDLTLLEQLSRTSPVFAPGVQNFYDLGGITELVDLAKLTDILLDESKKNDAIDIRSALAYTRGGRKMTAPVIQKIETQTL